MMDGSQQLEIVVPMVSKIIGNIRPDQLQNGTSCRGWAVRDVLDSFAAEVDPPAGADPLERLLAFCGRRP